MDKKEYEELNKYLNDISVYLDKKYSIILNNISSICEMNDEYYKHLYDNEFKKNNTQNNLTYNDVYMLAREIIESINPNYLKEFDKLINSGQLDFSYEQEYDDCEYVYIERGNKSYNLININREFNYNDVVNLIHEFIHYTNGDKKVTRNRYYLTEFLSIYFETYAIDYLINKGINKDEIDYEIRLESTFDRASSFYYVESPLICFMDFGSINDDNYEMFKFKYYPIDRSAFDKECRILLDYLRKIEKKYRENHFKDDYDYDEVIKDCANLLITNFKYLFGTILSMYAFKHCKKENILYLNEHINDDDSTDMVELLQSIGIDINDDNFLKEALLSIEEYLNKYVSVKGDL